MDIGLSRPALPNMAVSSPKMLLVQTEMCCEYKTYTPEFQEFIPKKKKKECKIAQ